jgi:hypothetical protein
MVSFEWNWLAQRLDLLHFDKNDANGIYDIVKRCSILPFFVYSYIGLVALSLSPGHSQKAQIDDRSSISAYYIACLDQALTRYRVKFKDLKSSARSNLLMLYAYSRPHHYHGFAFFYAVLCRGLNSHGTVWETVSNTRSCSPGLVHLT